MVVCKNREKLIAKNTRYEYVFIQWAFVNELQKIKANTDINISTNRNEYCKLDHFEKAPTGAEILQILILLTNAGHLPETFTAMRSFLHILLNNKEIRTIFRSGLDKRDRAFFDETLELFQIFHMQYIVSLFLLQRYTRLNKYGNGKDLVDLSSNILRDYTNSAYSGVLGHRFWLHPVSQSGLIWPPREVI